MRITFNSTLFFFFLAVGHLAAQNFEMQMRPDSVAGLEVNYRKLLNSDENFNFFSGNYDLRYRHVLGEKFNAVANVTYSDISIGQGGSIGGLANTYLGIQLKNSYKPNNQSAFEFGVFIPTGEEEGFVGALANYYDLPKYIDNTFGFRAAYQSFYTYEDGFAFGYELGPDFLIGSDEFSGDDFEALLRYGLNLSYAFSDFQLMTELLGLAVLSEDGDFGERTIHSYSLGLSYRIGSFVPRVFYKNYFDDIAFNSIDGIMGIGLYLEFN